MTRQLLSLIICFSLLSSATAQLHRSIDGSGNNLSNPIWGAAGAEMPRIASAAYADGISAPGGIGLTNPRIISNVLFAQDSLLNDALNLSDFVWVFGQFLDHDIVAVSNDPTEPASIPIDFDDEYFNPGGTLPNVYIHMFRSQAVSGTGTDVNNPRQYSNNITSWIDASNVYGSDLARANWLRSGIDGKLKTSAGDLLPYNTTDGEYDSPIDPNAPFMDNENPFISKYFVAGDSRANENSLLTALHTLFVREHNRLCDQLKALHPSWDDNTLYEEARRRVGAHIQAIVYEEWLPAMGISLPDYAGYDAGINPTISNEFSAAAFRLGHTLLNSHLHTMDNQGNVLAEIPLRDAFFNPPVLADMGLDPFFIGMAEQIQQEMDAKMVDEVRNFLFGTPGAGGLDLAAINIQRGRERGVPPFNILRADLGLSPYEDLEAFCDNPQIKQILLDYYGNINNIDAWVGLLLEEHMPGMLFGETIMHILMQQFGDLRDGDRYFYENDPYFPNGEIATIKETTFRDIIMRNTGVEIMQENVFEAIPHDSICMADGPLTDINGAIQTWTGLNVPNVNITATHVNDSTSITTTTLSDGTFLLEEAKSCAHYSLRPAKDGNYMNGVSTFDLVLISRHILEIEPLDSPYKIIAANVNNDDKVSTFDIVDLRKLILFVDTALANVDSWRFVDADYVFNDPTMPFDEDFPEYAEDHSVDQNAENLHFVAIKMGDVNGNADPEAFNENDTQARSEDELALVAIDQSLQAGQTIQVPVRSGDIDKVDGFQFALKMDRSALAFKGMTAQSLPALSASNIHYLEKEGLLLFSWNGSTDALNADDVLFTLQMEALREGQLSDFVHIHPHKLLAEAYAKNSLNILPLQWRFEQGESYPHSFTVLQNQPNPFRSQTAIAFQLPADSEVQLSIYDAAGRVLFTQSKDYEKGYHQIVIDRSQLAQSTGVLFYKVETDFGVATRKMTLMD